MCTRLVISCICVLISSDFTNILKDHFTSTGQTCEYPIARDATRRYISTKTMTTTKQKTVQTVFHVDNPWCCCHVLRQTYVTKWTSVQWFTYSINTLNRLNYIKDYNINHILDFVPQKKTRLIMREPYMLPIRCCQYHSCWCPGDLRSQGISKYCSDPQGREKISI